MKDPFFQCRNFFSPGLVFSLQEFSPEISLQDIFSEITHIPTPPPPQFLVNPLGSLRGRRSKWKGKGIRARDHARPNSPFPFPFPFPF